MRAAFLGLGLMGEPMARNLVRAGVGMTVWNRSAAAALQLQAEGAQVAPSARSALRAAPVAILMLRNSEAVDEVLERGTADFADNVARRTIVAMGTAAPDWSRQLGADITAAGGRYVECPVSGSRRPAEDATLVAMTAGAAEDVAAVRPLLGHMCASVFDCGPVPNALAAKLSVNVFLITLVTGLAEAAGFAQAQGVPLDLLRTLIDAGPMSSAVSSLKLDKLVRDDISPQAAISDVLMNARLILDAARETGGRTDLMHVCASLLTQAVARGDGALDMAAVLRSGTERI